MRFGYVIFEERPAVVAEKDSDGWRLLDIAHDLFDVLLGEWAAIEAAYKRGQVVPAENLRFLAPIPRPGKIVAIGQNYMDHVREQNVAPPEKPIIFAKFPSTVCGPNAIVEWSPALTSAVDYEAELAVVIG